MTVYMTHQRINALNEIVPDGFVFVLDTTDRSFMYTSKESTSCKQFINTLDQSKGIEQIINKSGFYSYEEGDAVLKIQKTAKNMFLGVCLRKSNYSPNNLAKIDRYFIGVEHPSN